MKFYEWLDAFMEKHVVACASSLEEAKAVAEVEIRRYWQNDQESICKWLSLMEREPNTWDAPSAILYDLCE